MFFNVIFRIASTINAVIDYNNTKSRKTKRKEKKEEKRKSYQIIQHLFNCNSLSGRIETPYFLQ